MNCSYCSDFFASAESFAKGSKGTTYRRERESDVSLVCQKAYDCFKGTSEEEAQCGGYRRITFVVTTVT